MANTIYETELPNYRVTTVVSGRYKQNCYVVVSTSARRAIVIDPGGRSDDITRIVESQADRAEAILLTHGHFDHLGAAYELSERWGIACLAHPRERRLIRQAPLYAVRFVKEGLRAPQRVESLDPVSGLDWDGTPVTIVECPGHTDGSVSFVFGGTMVFTGDALLHKRIGPTFYPGSDQNVLMASIDRLLAKLPESTIIFPGHGCPWTIGEAKAWWSGLTEPPPAYVIEQLG